LQRARYGVGRVSHKDALRWAARGSAACIGRPELGEIAVGKAADLALFNTAVMVSSAANALGCTLEGFPQNLPWPPPLSSEKLTLAAFTPLITKADCYLSGWHALLLSPASRLIFVNSVLDSLPTHAMDAMRLPIPPLSRPLTPYAVPSFGTPVSRPTVPNPRRMGQGLSLQDEGWLGVRALVVQNSCLLVKLLHRLHVDCKSPWAT
jgi:hypothetical protein